MHGSIIIVLLAISVLSVSCLDSNELLLKAASKLQQFHNEPNLLFDIDSIEKDFLSVKRNLMKSLLEGSNEQIPPLPHVSQKCLVQGYTLINGIRNQSLWALQVVDAWAKPESGIFTGNIQWLGSYSECIDSKDEGMDFKSRYCTLKKPAELRKGLTDLTPNLGLCFPKNCNSQDVYNLINYAINNIPENITERFNLTLKNITEEYVECLEPARIDKAASFAIFIISVLLALTSAGTVYDIFKQNNDKKIKRYIKNIQEVGYKNKLADENTEESKNQTEEIVIEQKKDMAKVNIPDEPLLLQIILCFSLYTNLRKLFTINKGGDQLDCLHCIRFMSMSWVVLGHTFAFLISFAENPATLFKWDQRFSFMIVNGGFFSVDSFFFMSGLLNSYLFMKEIKKRNFKFSIGLFIKYYIHRLWRITPPYALVLMFSACLTQYLGTGPHYPTKDGLDKFCRTNWWLNLLYINNIVKPDEMCFGVAWYLANDMQFYWIAPLILIPFALGLKNKILEFVGIGISSFFMFINILVVAILLANKDGSEMGIFGLESGWFMKNIYYTPWCRIGPFIVGIIAGYYIYKCKNNPNFKLDNILNFIGWFLALFTLGLMCFGTYPNFNANPSKHLNRVENILYQASSRILWSIALAWVVFACVMKKGGFLNDMLCLPIWTPLSRLSFCAYLIHWDILYWYFYSRETLVFVKELNMSYIFIGNMTFSYIAALIVSMLFEVPLLGLEKFIFGKKK